MDESAEITSACMLRFKFSFPMVLNNLPDDVDIASIATLARVYIARIWDGEMEVRAWTPSF